MWRDTRRASKRGRRPIVLEELQKEQKKHLQLFRMYVIRSGQFD